MPVGFVTYNGENSIQLTDEGVFFSLVTKGVVTDADDWVQEGSTSVSLQVTFNGVSRDHLPLMALHSSRSTWATLTSSTATSVTYTIFATGSGSVEYFLFTSRPPPANPSRCGLELYNAAGVRVFASDYPPMRPLGTLDNDGYEGLALSGRKLAHVPVIMESYSFLEISSGGLGTCQISGTTTAGYQLRRREGWRRSAVRAGTGTVSYSPRTMNIGPYPYYCSTSPTNQINSTGYPNFKSLIIDVTNN